MTRLAGGTEKLEESLEYIKNNWHRIIRHVKSEEESIAESNTKSHISHVLSSRLSFRLMGWCREGPDKIVAVCWVL